MNNYLTKIQELELLSALDTRGESPTKFMYLGDGFKRWIKIAEESRNHEAVQFQENKLKIESLPFIFRHIDKDDTVNIIDLGCGDGIPMLPVFDELKNNKSLKYIPIDISDEMLAVAKKNVSDNFPTIDVIPIQFDFEKSETLEELFSITRGEKAKNFFFLLGNTLGNFDNTEKILTNIKLLMSPNDYLIIGNEISNLLASPKLVNYYKTDEVFRISTTTLQNYGANLSKEEFDVRWNTHLKQIEIFVKLNANREIKIADQSVYFEKGEEIMLIISKKFTEDSLMVLFNKVGFRTDFFTSNKKKDTCIISISPTRYKS